MNDWSLYEVCSTKKLLKRFGVARYRQTTDGACNNI
jgi:hypothetical protein